MILHRVLQRRTGRLPEPVAPHLPATVERWLANDDGRSLLGHNRSTIVRAHPVDCVSLAGLWLPRRGGFTDLCELEDCAGCGLTFLIDAVGLHFVADGVQKYLSEGDEDWYDAYWCDCCWRGREAGAGS